MNYYEGKQIDQSQPKVNKIVSVKVSETRPCKHFSTVA